MNFSYDFRRPRPRSSALFLQYVTSCWSARFLEDESIFPDCGERSSRVLGATARWAQSRTRGRGGEKEEQTKEKRDEKEKAEKYLSDPTPTGASEEIQEERARVLDASLLGRSRESYGPRTSIYPSIHLAVRTQCQCRGNKLNWYVASVFESLPHGGTIWAGTIDEKHSKFFTTSIKGLERCTPLIRHNTLSAILLRLVSLS